MYQPLLIDSSSHKFPSANYPTTSAAMSAFIKGIRLRFTDDAVYWLHYLNFFPEKQYALRRRVLLAAGEDNLSIPVIQSAGDYLTGAKTATLHDTATEVIKICRTQNWWRQDDGHQYIRFWRIITAVPNRFSDYQYQDVVGELAEALAENDRMRSGLAIIRLSGFKEYNPKAISTWLIKEAEKRDADEAAETLEVMLRHPSIYKRDDNILAQAHFRMFVGSLGEQENPDVDPDEVQELLDQAEAKWKAPKPIPSYYLDGMHTAGKDKRFAGIPTSMYGMCRAYKKFKRLHPDDIWPSDFWWKVEE